MCGPLMGYKEVQPVGVFSTPSSIFPNLVSDMDSFVNPLKHIGQSLVQNMVFFSHLVEDPYTMGWRSLSMCSNHGHC